ncbi:calcium-dependent protein kinase, putative, partial [Perkinsus marinus ATCC 50983]
MYIVMELYTGPDLFDYIISNRPVTEEKAAFILEQISRATNFLHTQGGMHRDLKPENFMFENDTPGAALKLVDFGSTTGSRCAHLEEYLFH